MQIAERVRATDIEIAYEVVGSGTPVVTVHGGPGLGHGYMRGLDVLADEYQIVFYDQRGTGRTALGDADKVTFAGAPADLENGLTGALRGAADRAGARGAALGTMAERRTSTDEAEREEIEASEAFAQRDPKTLERYFLNKYIAFFDDRSSISKVDVGLTEITAANVLDALTVRMLYGWAHAFAILDILRRRQKGWQPTGAKAANRSILDSQFRHRALIWGGGTACVWLGTAGWDVVARSWMNHGPILLVGLLYAAVLINAARPTTRARGRAGEPWWAYLRHGRRAVGPARVPLHP